MPHRSERRRRIDDDRSFGQLLATLFVNSRILHAHSDPIGPLAASQQDSRHRGAFWPL
jgi:hypothetical protein